MANVISTSEGAESCTWATAAAAATADNEQAAARRGGTSEHGALAAEKRYPLPPPSSAHSSTSSGKRREEYAAAAPAEAIIMYAGAKDEQDARDTADNKEVVRVEAEHERSRGGAATPRPCHTQG